MDRESITVWLNEMTWQDVKKYLDQNDIIIIPVGSTEQHGPALPLGNDTYVAITLAEDAARETGSIVCPPLWFGESAHHMGFAGTITLRPLTLIEVIKDICKSLIHHGFKKLVIINGHRGANLPALNLAVKQLHQDEFPEIFFAVIDPFKISRFLVADIRETEVIGHAGEMGTSQMIYKFPELVRKERIKREIPNFKPIFSSFYLFDPYISGESIDIPMNSREEEKITTSGIIGDATKASSEKGKKYHDYMVRNIVSFIEWLKTHPTGKFYPSR